MTAKSSTERGSARVARLVAAGLKMIRNLWAHPADEPAIRDYAAKLARKRERMNKTNGKP